jgi:uncharacterized protein (DUF433 family)
MVEWRERIVRNPNIMVGKPAVAGTRITVELLLDLLASGETVESILQDYPQLKQDDILAALAYAADALSTDELVMASNR